MKIFEYFNSLVPYVYAQGGQQEITGHAGNYVKPVITNPLNAETLPELVAAVLKLVYEVGLPLIVIMFIYAGFLYVTAQGDTGKIKEAHNSFKWTVVGAIIVLGAAVMAAIIEGTIKSLGAK